MLCIPRIPTGLETTDDLIRYYKAAAATVPNAELEVAIPVAIDAAHTARDVGANTHVASAAVAVAVLQALKAR